MEYLSAIQRAHTAAVSAPVPVEYVPAAHGLQMADDIAPEAVEKVPAKQSPHVVTVETPVPVQ